MTLVDTHCHLDFKDFDDGRELVLERARSAGVVRIINVGSSLEGSRRAVGLSQRYDMVYASVGVHPHDAASVTGAVMEELKRLAGEPKVVAIGEVGLDFYRNLSPRDKQIEVFEAFIGLAGELKLPLIIHSRDADAEILDMLRRTPDSIRRTAVMHCFSGDEAFLKEVLGLGLHVSFTCKLTLKNADAMRAVAARVPPERLLLETDAPYLLPAALKNKKIPNEPANLAYLAGEWSRILKLSVEDVGRITTHNANALFGLGLDEPSKIAYAIRDSLYLNITNACTNACSFCVRNEAGEFVKGHNLWLEKEPSAAELVAAAGDPSQYKEIVFCGYGEPTMRLDVVLGVASALKKKGARIRIVTNGHANLINGPRTADRMKGLVDRVSVSLNAQDKALYDSICRPKLEGDPYAAMLDFISECVSNGIAVEATCLELPGVDVKRCEEIARSLGAAFRLRKYGNVG
jgi:TatD DNase family protein